MNVKKRLAIILAVLFLISTVVTACADFYAQHGIVMQTGATTIVMTRDGNLWAVNDDGLHCGDKVFVVLHDNFTDCKEDDEVVICLAEF